MTEYNIHGPDYRPSNVRVEQHEGDGRWYVYDFDGQLYASSNRRDEAERYAKTRKAVIKAALTRRRNKARRAASE